MGGFIKICDVTPFFAAWRFLHFRLCMLAYITVVPLTPMQQRVLAFIREFVVRHRFAPTAAEIAAEFGIAEKNGFYYLSVLERKGQIRRRRHSPRLIEFPAASPPRLPRAVPILARLPAAPAEEAMEPSEQELALDPALVGEGDLFALRVAGDGMTGAHICDGDYVVVRAQPDAEDGSIVVAIVNGEPTVKRIYRGRSGLRLEAANPAHPPVVVSGHPPWFRIAGKVVGVYRKF